ncbi:MAG: hypothetical protein R3C00_13990, partial [Hyphomonas sp.]
RQGAATTRTILGGFRLVRRGRFVAHLELVSATEGALRITRGMTSIYLAFRARKTNRKGQYLQ